MNEALFYLVLNFCKNKKVEEAEICVNVMVNCSWAEGQFSKNQAQKCIKEYPKVRELFLSKIKTYDNE